MREPRTPSYLLATRLCSFAACSPIKTYQRPAVSGFIHFLHCFLNEFEGDEGG